MQTSSVNGEKYVLERANFNALFAALKQRGFCVIGPTVRDGAIVYDEIESDAELPAGISDRQEGGYYRLEKRTDEALFSFTVGPVSWKKFLFPPSLLLWQAEKQGTCFRISREKEKDLRYAFLGVRPCEIHALLMQDKIFLEGPAKDLTYKTRRENLFIVSVQCGVSGGTCFCASMGTGPKATEGFDIALTEILDNEKHYFVIDIGTEKGKAMVEQLPIRPADSTEQTMAESIVNRTAENMGRSLDTSRIKELLYANYAHPRWEHVANRCLSCANCTMVCPTCFCTNVEDVTDLTGEHAQRWRKWDSCFNLSFSYIHGGSIRRSVKSRYRQWMTHKLATWIDQFGTSGCVGCGKCITWCPVGIDITEEVRAIRSCEINEGSRSFAPLSPS